MRKIIYNEKIKKLLIGIIITAMVFNYILPLKVVYAEQKMNFEDYVMYRVRKLGVKTYDIPENDDLVINQKTVTCDFTDESQWSINKVWQLMSEVGQTEGHTRDYYIYIGAIKDIYSIISPVENEIKKQVVVKDEFTIGENIENLLQIQGLNVDVIFDDKGNVSEVDLSRVDFNDPFLEGLEIKKKDDNNDNNDNNNEDKISEGIYINNDSLMKGKYYCTANKAGKTWNTNYIYGIIQDKLIETIAAIQKEKDTINWPKVFEDYGDDINMMRVYFYELGEKNEPTGEQPTSKDIWVGGISPNDLALNEDYRLPEGEEPTYYTELYEEETGAGSSDLGGILLSPIFSLVNFVADAIVSGLETIMMGEGSGFLGLGVLSTKKSSAGTYTNTVSRYVNTDSFLGIGSLKYQYPHITYTPEEIFAGQVPLLSIDFISGKYYDKNTGATANELNKGWTSIRKVISQWYQVLRMIAIIGFLSVLIYTGIKIIISSNAKDKAKYKEWIINWLVGIAILFFMHYIMAFIISINGEFSNLISSSFTGIHVTPSDNSENVFDTNLMGLVRFMVQSQNFYIKVGYEIMYIALIVYTIKFTFIYLKRVLNMAFLTLIAPIVALTYPIDKMNDGKAQGFDMWLKEYVFNALLQPMHCILYYVLVGTAIDVAVSNPIYAVVVLAFMTEAEKIFKKIFGFDKANPGTVGGMSSAFAAGAIASGIVKDVAKFSKGNKGKGGNAGGNAQNNPLDNVKPLESGSIEDNFKDNLLDGGSSSNGNTMGGTSTGGSSSNGNTTGRTSTSGNSSNGNSTSRNNSTNRNSSTDSKEPATGKGPSVKNGLKNVGKKLVNPVYAIGRGKEYNKKRWLRRLGKGAKGVGKLAIGTAAAAVQAGISITDGKYTLKEGIASFAAGYAGGEKILNGIGKPISSVVGAYREGYHEGDEGYLRERQKQQFMDNDEIYKMYKNKYGSKAETMQRLAADNMVPYGYTDVKEQFKIQKMANEIIKKNDQYKNYDNTQKQEYMEKALKQARNTKAFIDSPGVSGIVHSPGKQEDYIKAEIKSRGITDEKSQEAQAIRTGLQNAFNSAAVWQQVNK